MGDNKGKRGRYRVGIKGVNDGMGGTFRFVF